MAQIVFWVLIRPEFTLLHDHRYAVSNPHIFKKKGRDLTQSYDKSPYNHRKIQKATRQHKNATKNFEYTTIADQLRTVSRGNDSHPTCVVKPVDGILS